MRHPGCVGALLHSLAVPLIVGLAWAMILRTALEDRTMRIDLDCLKVDKKGIPEYNFTPHVGCFGVAYFSRRGANG